jgi:predicted PurR-regulated permease PerM
LGIRQEIGMSKASEPAAPRQAHLIARRVLMIAVLLVSLWVAWGFLVPLAWAAVLAITFWPLHERVASRLGGPAWLTPALFTAATAVILIVPLVFLAIEAARDSGVVLQWLAAARQHGLPTPDWVQHLPLIGQRAAGWWQASLGTPEAANATLGQLNPGALFSMTGAIGAQVARESILFFVTLLGLYSLLRHGAALAAQLTALSARLWGELGARIIDRMVRATRGTVAGTVLIALGEGCLIGAAYVVAGVPRPFLFTILTIAFAMLPFGAWLMFTIAAAVLVAQGFMLAAALLFVFSVIVMLVGDNLVQPAVVGNAIRLPFVLAFLGTFGGIEAFGLVGLFLGPVIMAMLLLLWHEALDGPEFGRSVTRATSKAPPR